MTKTPRPRIVAFPPARWDAVQPPRKKTSSTPLKKTPRKKGNK